ncbi:hypothetical protein [Bifidobacterium coryneforme]|uniref:hypothetical protein n=2 Tax=Bifidobacterium TaxID=1678 RepID=UPI0005298BF6|nr:hypothetical protein [Bifidobacterium coryneforme]
MTARITNRKRPVTAKEAARRLGISERTVRNIAATPRAQWLREKAEEREEIRRYHDEGGHSWSETGAHFGLTQDTVKRRAYRARKERAAEKREAELLATMGEPLF